MMRLICMIVAIAMHLNVSLGQKIGQEYLAIVSQPADVGEKSLLYYPPGSTFEVVNKQGKSVTPIQQSVGVYQYEGLIRLIVRPSNSSQPEKSSLTAQQLTIFTSAQAAELAGLHGSSSEIASAPNKEISEDEPEATFEPVFLESNANKEITPSETFPGRYNLRLAFDNGLVFVYFDGETMARFQGKEMSIRGKYIINNDIGTTKISFNPKTGKNLVDCPPLIPSFSESRPMCLDEIASYLAPHQHIEVGESA